MKEIKFTTNYEQVLSITDINFKTKYEERIGDNPDYVQVINGETKHLAVCPRCNNPVVILGIYKKISVSPHARHARGIDIPGVARYDEYKYLNCPYHKKSADYVREYVPETEEPQRHELYKIAKEHFDKAVYLLQKKTGIYISYKMAELFAENYVKERAYNYIDATVYNIPWYLIYCFHGFPLYHMVVRKGTTLCKQLASLGFKLLESNIKDHVYVGNKNGYLLNATNYRYAVDQEDRLNEWLDFSITRPDPDVTDTILYIPVARFSVKVDSNYFGSLIHYEKWKPKRKMLEIAEKCMNP